MKKTNFKNGKWAFSALLLGLFFFTSLSPEKAESAAFGDADLLGEIKLWPNDKIPRGWAKCDGRILKITDNTELFSLIGTTYGGDGQTTFALPDLRGRTAIHPGQFDSYYTSARDNIKLGEQGGSETFGGALITVEKAAAGATGFWTVSEAINTKSNRQPSLGLHYIVLVDLGVGNYPARS